MVRRLGLLAFALLSSGCVPVTAPVGNIPKDSDMNLVGEWEGDNTLTIDVPKVIGNPTGLMRAVTGNKSADAPTTIWFYTTTIGGKSYANIFLPKANGGPLSFSKEGAFTDWTKEKNQRFYIFRYNIDKSDGKTTKLVVDGGKGKEFNSLMDMQKFKLNATGSFEVPLGWLAKYLETNSDKIYDGTNTQKFTKK